MEEMDQKFLNGILWIFFFLLLFIGFFALAEVITSKTYLKAVFPYTEPSHFSLFFVSVLYYAGIKAKKGKVFIIIFGLLIALLVKNLTLLVAIFILLLSLFRWYALFLLPLIVLFVFNNFELDYFTDRLNFSNDSDNLSTLVYLQGWELMGQTLKMSHGFGIGFQQLGEIPMKRTPSGQIIHMITRKDYNITDAGFTSAKLVCELGILGIVLIFLYLRIFAKCWIRLGKKDLLNNSNAYIFANCVIVSYFAEFFVRGVGYFNPTTFMLFVALFICFRQNKKMKEELKNA